jgi:peptidoglycan/LPS O-acetylase OafA/YrhL
VQWRQLFANGFFMVDFINAFDFLRPHFPDNTWINPIFATLKVELQFYLLIGLLFPFIVKNKQLFLLSTILLLAIGVYTHESDTFFVNAPFFLLGLTAFFIRQVEFHRVYIIAAVIIFVDLISIYAIHDTIVAIIAFALIMWLPNNFKVLNLTGKISYSFYLIHGLSGQQFLYFMRNTTLSKEYPYLLIIFALLIAWSAAFLIYQFVEKPSIGLSKKFKYKNVKTKL